MRSDLNLFDELTQATLELNEKITSNENFEIKSSRSSLDDWIEDTLAPSSPGILFKVECGISTFCIKGVTTENLLESYSTLLDFDEELSSTLKIETEEELSQVLFFPVDDIYYAELIKKEILNRRFPIKEDQLFNISDPGFSWWFDFSDEHISVYFSSHGIDREKEFLRLGPIGNGDILCKAFNNNMDILCKLFDISEFVCTDKNLSIIVRQPDDYFFLPLKDVFINGHYDPYEDVFGMSKYSPELHSLFIEFANKRRFWIVVENFINSLGHI